MAATISRQFNSFSGANPFAAKIDASANASLKAQDTILSLVSNVSTKINMDLSQKVDPTKPGAQCVAANAIKGIQAAKQVLDGQIAAAFEGIASLQAEIVAATKASGRDVGEVFPAAHGNDGGDFLISALADLKGGGSLSTFMDGISKMSSVSDIAENAQGRTAVSVNAEIQDILVWSSNPIHMKQASFGHIRDGNAAPEGVQQSGHNWGEILAQHPEALEAIMYFDPSNPQSIKQISPDLAEMVAASMDADGKIAELEDVIKHADEMGTPQYGADEACYMVQLDSGFANLNAAPGSGNWGMTGAVASMLMKPEEVSRETEIALAREAELAEMARRAAAPVMPGAVA